jgi:DNA-binding NarL/FixJ family response regulator
MGVLVPERASGGTDGARIRVLIVDDHRLVAEGLASVFSQTEDISVAGIAGTAGEAIEMARLHEPDVVLMDYGLPDGNGAETAAHLRKERPETMVVMVTSFVDDAILLAAIEAGCCGYITKDRSSDEVVAAVRAASQGEALISPSMLGRLLPKLRPGGRKVDVQDLSARELEILRLMADGLQNKQIASKAHVSINTIRNHVQSIFQKLDAHSKLEAVATAVKRGLIQLS